MKKLILIGQLINLDLPFQFLSSWRLIYYGFTTWVTHPMVLKLKLLQKNLEIGTHFHMQTHRFYQHLVMIQDVPLLKIVLLVGKNCVHIIFILLFVVKTVFTTNRYTRKVKKICGIKHPVTWEYYVRYQESKVLVPVH